MATVAQLVEMMSTVTMTDKRTVNVYARALIDGGALPKSTGRAVANVSVEHAAKLLLALALKPKIRAAADLVDLYGRLQAETNQGSVTALTVLSDLFGAASAGGIRDGEWTEVSVIVFDDRLGIDVHLPASRHSAKSNRKLRFRAAVTADIRDLASFVLGPNPYFSRSAEISFEALSFICQLMNARQRDSTPQGQACVDRLLSFSEVDGEGEHDR